MPKDMLADVKIEAVAGKPVELPSGHFLSNADMSRSGSDLHITGPNGHTIIVEGYFAQQVPPDLVTQDGARLTPAMVNAFVPPEHAGQYAASGQVANDASPAGKITKVVGDAHIIHADGTKTVAHEGSLIYQGDVVETAKNGAVNMQFSDNTTFAISDNARMSVDQYVYHASNHTGSTFFSMLQGVFVYTSGLIGKSDPGAVNIETPVGSIGIRGTVIAAHILPAGHNSQITIVDGAITLTNGTGTQELNDHLQTVSVNGYQSQPQSISMDASTFNSAYSSMSSVVGGELSHFTGMSTTSAPAVHTAPAIESAPPSAPATGSSFGSGSGSTFASSAPESSGSSAAPAASSSTGSGVVTAPAGSTSSAVVVPHDTTGTGGNGGNPGNSGGTTPLTITHVSESGSTGSAVAYTVTFSDNIAGNTAALVNDIINASGSNPTITNVSISGNTLSFDATPTTSGALHLDINLLNSSDLTNQSNTVSLGTSQVMIDSPASVYSADFTANSTHFSTGSLQEFSSVGTQVGQMSVLGSGVTGTTTYSIIAGNSGSDVAGSAISGVGPFNSTPSTAVFSIDSATGIITVADQMALYNPNNNHFDLIVQATNGTQVSDYDVHITVPTLTSNGGEYFIGTNATTNFTGTTGGDVIFGGTGGGAQIDGGGGADYIFGGSSGGNTITVEDGSFKFIDGGGNSTGNTLYLEGASTLNFISGETNADTVTNISTLYLSSASATVTGSQISLDLASVFDMTNAASNHILDVYAGTNATGSQVNINTEGLTFNVGLSTASIGNLGTGAAGSVYYTGTYQGQNVTLVIHEATLTGAGHVNIVANTAVH